MYKYIKAYKLGYYEGYKNAHMDYINKRRKRFKKINIKYIRSKV